MLFKRRKKRIDVPAKAKALHEGVGRMAHRVAGPLIKLYVSEKQVRVRVLVISEDKELLLVRSWFGRQKWSLPGGGIQRTERPVEAAAREVFEETGIRIGVDDLHELGTFLHPNPKEPYTIACFMLSIPKRPPHLAYHRRIEMLDAAWFPLTHLPEERSGVVDIAVSLLK